MMPAGMLTSIRRAAVLRSAVCALVRRRNNLFLNRAVLFVAGGVSLITSQARAGVAGPNLTVSPGAKTIHASTNFQLIVTTENITNPTIIWYVNDVKGGDISTGTISSSGIFFAPATVPASNPVIVKAVLMVSP